MGLMKTLGTALILWTVTAAAAPAPTWDLSGYKSSPGLTAAQAGDVLAAKYSIPAVEANAASRTSP